MVTFNLQLDGLAEPSSIFFENAVLTWTMIDYNENVEDQESNH